jgi:hypothetical protein
MFQFPGSFGYSGIGARWAAPPDISQPSTPEILVTPRHPPRALRSLTTPARCPPVPCGNEQYRPGAMSGPESELIAAAGAVSRRAGRLKIQGNDPLMRPRASRDAQGRGPRLTKRSTFVEILGMIATTTRRALVLSDQDACMFT